MVEVCGGWQILSYFLTFLTPNATNLKQSDICRYSISNGNAHGVTQHKFPRWQVFHFSTTDTTNERTATPMLLATLFRYTTVNIYFLPLTLLFLILWKCIVKNFLALAAIHRCTVHPVNIHKWISCCGLEITVTECEELSHSTRAVYNDVSN